jgi:hypothetical protein
MTDDLVKRPDDEQDDLTLVYMWAYKMAEKKYKSRIEQLEKGFRDILTLDDSMLMQMIAKACLTGAIDDQGKYCFVPPAALGEKKDD